MSRFGKTISKLQQKPYRERKKILHRVVIGTVIILLLIWVLTLRYRYTKTDTSPSKFAPILENLKKLKGQQSDQEL